MLKDETFESLYLDELQELYSAERQIVSALPEMIQDASTADLKTALEMHLDETKVQVRRLETILGELDETPGIGPCQGMIALLAQGRMRISERRSSAVMDTSLIAAVRQVEHYEICAYESARTLAEMLRHESAARLLQQTLREEKEADSTLIDIAESLIMGEELEEVVAEEEEAA